jgi:hypothetical protein
MTSLLFLTYLPSLTMYPTFLLPQPLCLLLQVLFLSLRTK